MALRLGRFVGAWLLLSAMLNVRFPGDETKLSYLWPSLDITLVLLAIALVAMFVRFRGGSAGTVGLVFRQWPLEFLIGVGTAIVTGFVVIVITLTLMISFPAFARQMQENGARIVERVPRLTPASFAAMTLLIGLYEELVFRGFLLPRLRRALGSWAVAIVASTLVFSLLHLKDQVAAAMVLVSILSLSFSVVTIWRKSILPAVVAHALFDFAMLLNLSIQAGDRWK